MSRARRWRSAHHEQRRGARGRHALNDIRDLAALSIAVAGCDLVATEKQWVHELIKANVDRMTGTTLRSNVADLAAVL